MSNKVKIAVDAMGGENSPHKIVDGIEISLKLNKDNFAKGILFTCIASIFWGLPQPLFFNELIK